jgi:hypothetical protein
MLVLAWKVVGAGGERVDLYGRSAVRKLRGM